MIQIGLSIHEKCALLFQHGHIVQLLYLIKEFLAHIRLYKTEREKAIRSVSLDFHSLNKFKKKSLSKKRKNFLGPLLDKLLKEQGELQNLHFY